jgi:probable F420-dependent oxidoreductase
MELGVSVPHIGPLASPAFVVEFCRQAEAAGFSALWVADHLAIPREMESEYTLTRRPAVIESEGLRATMGANLEMVSTLAVAAAVTTKIRLATGVAVLPLRNPILNARQLASVDLYSGGRLVLGVGVGWLQEEADAIGMPWDRRGARAEEHIAVLRSIWTAGGEDASFEGDFYGFPPIDPRPQPGRSIPVIIGGHSQIALGRAARIGDGWLASGMSPDRLTEALESLRALCERHERDFADLWIACSVPVRLDAKGRSPAVLETLRRYEALGVDHVSVAVRGATEQHTFDELRRWSDEVVTHLTP